VVAVSGSVGKRTLESSYKAMVNIVEL
jgi:hypothetical protein